MLRLTLHAGSYDWQFLDAGLEGHRQRARLRHRHLSRGRRRRPRRRPPAPPRPRRPPLARRARPGAAAAQPGYWMVDSGGRSIPSAPPTATATRPVARRRRPRCGRPRPVRLLGRRLRRSGQRPGRGAAARQRAGRVAAGGETVTSLSPTPSGRGYWLFTNRGRVFTFGDGVLLRGHVQSGAERTGPRLGSDTDRPGLLHGRLRRRDLRLRRRRLRRFDGRQAPQRPGAGRPVPGPDGGGYWLVASDGGVFAFNAPSGAPWAPPPPSRSPEWCPMATATSWSGRRRHLRLLRPALRRSLGGHPPTRPIVSVAAVP